MALICGCEVRPGRPICPEMLKRHKKHTLEAMFLWELLRRPGVSQDTSPDSLSMKRIEYVEALDKAFPEAILTD